jgi:hypothetical protein
MIAIMSAYNGPAGRVIGLPEVPCRFWRSGAPAWQDVKLW